MCHNLHWFLWTLEPCTQNHKITSHCQWLPTQSRVSVLLLIFDQAFLAIQHIQRLLWKSLEDSSTDTQAEYHMCMEADFTFKTLEALAILNKNESRAFINVNLKGRSQLYLQSSACPASLPVPHRNTTCFTTSSHNQTSWIFLLHMSMQILHVICGEDLTNKMREVDIILYPKRGFPGLPNSLNCFLQLLQHVPTIWPSVHKTQFSLYQM